MKFPKRRRWVGRGRKLKKEDMQLNFILVFSLILLRQSYDTQLKLVLHYVDPVGFEITFSFLILLSAGITDMKLTILLPPQCWDYKWNSPPPAIISFFGNRALTCSLGWSEAYYPTVSLPGACACGVCCPAQLCLCLLSTTQQEGVVPTSKCVLLLH